MYVSSSFTSLELEEGLMLIVGRDVPVLDAAGRLGKIVVGMNKSLGDIPVTVKLRTGVKDGRNTAHKLMPRLPREFGVGAVTVSLISSAQAHTP